MKTLRKPKVAQQLEKVGSELTALIDTEIRWNNTLRMLQRYLELHPTLRTLPSLQRNEYSLESAEEEKLKMIVAALLPVKAASNKLPRERNKFLDADETFGVRFRKLCRWLRCQLRRSGARDMSLKRRTLTEEFPAFDPSFLSNAGNVPDA